MNYLSVCAGIEAATVAWHDLGWKATAYSEIEPFPSAVLAHHYPQTPNLGDMTRYRDWSIDEPINLLVGGTPCQSFSVAGLRKGLDDPRGNLALVYLGIADHFRPRWIVWENVPGVLSSNKGRDFGAFLGALGELGYGWAYRVLDAQFFGVAQRRRRVFVVGCLGDWASAAAVLFERQSLRRDTAPSREAGQKAAPAVSTGAPFSRTGNERVECDAIVACPMFTDCYNGSITGDVACTMGTSGSSVNASGPTVMQPIAFGWQNISSQGLSDSEQVTPTLDKSKTPAVFTASSHGAYKAGVGTLRAHGGDLGGGSESLVTQPYEVANTLTARMHKGMNSDCNEGQTPVMQPAYGIPGNWIGRKPENGGNVVKPMHNVSPCLTSTDKHGVAQPMPINTMVALRHEALGERTGFGVGEPGDPAYTMTKAHSHAVYHNMAVRRLTPTECERLQGFPDGYTAIPWRKKKPEDCPDGHRYKALGNSMAVPVMRWIGERIAQVEAIK